jgi:outer membrane protein assembly factor BamB
MSDERFHELELDRFWDEVVRSPSLPVAGEFDLAATDRQLIRRFQTRGAVSPPDAVRERVRRDVLSSIGLEHHSKETPVNQTAILDITRPDAGPNGRTIAPTRRWPRLRFPASRRWLVAQAAMAVLLVIAILGIYLVVHNHNQTANNPPATPEATPASDVPMYRGNAARTGVMPGPGPAGQPIELWRYQVKGEIHSAPAIVDGVLYFGGGDGGVYAVDAETGKERWHFSGNSPISSSPAVVENVVYVGSDDGTLYAIDAATGKERWNFPGSRPNASPAVVGETVYVGSEDGFAFALDAATGQERWRAPLGASASRSPAVADGVAYIGSTDGILHALDAASGAERWRFQIDGGGTITTPAVADGTIYQATFDSDANQFYAIDAATGKELWRFAASSGGGFSPPSIGGGMVYLASDDSNVYGLDRATGEKRWQFATRAPVSAAPALINDTLYVGSYDRTLYALDAATGSEDWQYALDGAVDYGPVVTRQVIYVGTTFGFVFAIGGTESRIGAPSLRASPTVAASPEASGPVASSTAAAPFEFLWQTTGEPEPFVAPAGANVDAQGNLWVVDAGSNQIKIFAPDGSLLDRWDGTGGGGETFKFIQNTSAMAGDVAFDAQGNIYVVGRGGQRVQKYAPDRTLITSWGGFGTKDGEFMDPICVDVDKDGNVYVSDNARSDVQKFASDGRFLLSFGDLRSGDGSLDGAACLAVDDAGSVWVAEFNGNRVVKFASDGTYLASWGGAGTEAGKFNQPTCVATDEQSNVYVADLGNGRVQVFDSTGQYLVELDAGSTPRGTQNLPYCLTLDGKGNLYIVGVKGPDNLADGNVQKFRLLPPLAPEATPTA